MRILGISAYYHDSAAALVEDGRVVAAAQEERFSRKKHDPGFPGDAIAYCLREGGVRLDRLDHVVYYEKPFLKFERLLETYLALAPRGWRSFQMAIPVWLREKLFLRRLLGRELRRFSEGDDWSGRLLFTGHHQSHAASAFFPSPFADAAILTMDGVGEWATTSMAVGRGNRLETLQEIHFPHSLGLLYSAFTYYAGFKVNSGEYKLMGLAPLGEPRYARTIRDHLIDIKSDGSFRLNLDYFDYCTGLRMTNHRFDRLFGGPPRRSDEEIGPRHRDVAASIQTVLEDVVLRMTRSLQAETKARNLCLAGGVALNCTANGAVLRDGRFERVWAQPASGDAGGALGAALAVYYLHTNSDRGADARDGMAGAYLGPEFPREEIERRLREAGARFEVLSPTGLIQRAAAAIDEGEILGWFQGRMEFGPRALGARSILADARSPEMQSRLNRQIKFRESFRPFAPAVLAEDAKEWFDLDVESPYMMFTARVAERHMRREADRENPSEIPAVTHVDGSSRLQTVHRETNPRFHALIEAFRERTGCPIIVNTSFNVRGEPIVCRPEEAFRCFMGTGMDALAIGDCYLQKRDQNPELATGYARDLEPD